LSSFLTTGGRCARSSEAAIVRVVVVPTLHLIVDKVLRLRRGPTGRVVSLTVLASLLAACGSSPAPTSTGVTGAAVAGVVKNYADSSDISGPTGITAGPDGALWFTNRNYNVIGSVTTAGVFTSDNDPSSSFPWGITTGPDGALWFTNVGNNVIGRITTAGASSFYTDPTVVGPAGITTGPDGALWFANISSIGRITTAGVITNYTTTPPIDKALGITAGPDGTLWFTDYGNNSIGRITTAGVITNFTSPKIKGPYAITAGPDGALWFTNDLNGSIGRITTSGVVTSYTASTVAGPDAITVGPDGALWFTNNGNNSIGRITTKGVITNYTSPTISAPDGIAAGPDGALWFTNLGNNSIGRITTDRPEKRAIISSDSLTTSAGSGFTFTVSTTGSPAPSITETGALPNGVRFVDNRNGTATLSGSPTQAEVHHLTIRATYLEGTAKKVLNQTFTLTVTAG
jgi:virginiamycin B lyase